MEPRSQLGKTEFGEGTTLPCIRRRTKTKMGKMDSGMDHAAANEDPASSAAGMESDKIDDQKRHPAKRSKREKQIQRTGERA